MNNLANLAVEQRRAFVTALLYIATIDGSYPASEQEFVRSAFRAAQLTEADEADVARLLKERPPLAHVLAPIKRTPVARLLVRELISLAYADGEYASAERSGVSAISDELGLSRDWLSSMEAWIAEGVAWHKRGSELLEG